MMSKLPVGGGQLPDRRRLGDGDVIEGAEGPENHPGQQQAAEVVIAEGHEEPGLFGDQARKIGQPGHQGRQPYRQPEAGQGSDGGDVGHGFDPVGQVESEDRDQHSSRQRHHFR